MISDSHHTSDLQEYSSSWKSGSAISLSEQVQLHFLMQVR